MVWTTANRFVSRSNWIAWTFSISLWTEKATSRSNSRRGLRSVGQHGEHGQVSRTEDARSVTAATASRTNPSASCRVRHDHYWRRHVWPGGGIRLAHYDQKVCILERHTTIGGLNSFYRMNGRDYDVGLHAVTNFTPAGAKKGPLARLLRQLRFRWEEFELSEQCGSAIAFPGVRLGFTNDINFLKSENRSRVSSAEGQLRALARTTGDYDDLNQENFAGSTRQSCRPSSPTLCSSRCCCAR